jgi:hypothetical protein
VNREIDLARQQRILDFLHEQPLAAICVSVASARSVTGRPDDDDLAFDACRRAELRRDSIRPDTARARCRACRVGGHVRLGFRTLPASVVDRSSSCCS